MLGFLKAVFQTCPVGGKYILIAVLDSLVGSFLPIQTEGFSSSVGLICPAVGRCSWPIVINLCSLDLGAALQGLGQTDLWTTSFKKEFIMQRHWVAFGLPLLVPTGMPGLPRLRKKYSWCPPIATRWIKALTLISTITPIELKINTFVQLATGTKMVAGKAKEGQVWTIGKLGLKNQANGAIGSWIFSLVWNFTPTKS